MILTKVDKGDILVYTGDTRLIRNIVSNKDILLIKGQKVEVDIAYSQWVWVKWGEGIAVIIQDNYLEIPKKYRGGPVETNLEILYKSIEDFKRNL